MIIARDETRDWSFDCMPSQLFGSQGPSTLGHLGSQLPMSRWPPGIMNSNRASPLAAASASATSQPLNRLSGFQGGEANAWARQSTVAGLAASGVATVKVEKPALAMGPSASATDSGTKRQRRPSGCQVGATCWHTTGRFSRKSDLACWSFQAWCHYQSGLQETSSASDS